MKVSVLKAHLKKHPVHDDGLLPNIKNFFRRRFETSPVIDRIESIANRYSDSDTESEFLPIEELQLGKLCKNHEIPEKNAKKFEKEDLTCVHWLQTALFSRRVDPLGYHHNSTLDVYEALEYLREHQDLLKHEYFDVIKQAKMPFQTKNLLLVMHANKCIDLDILKLFSEDNWFKSEALINWLPTIKDSSVYKLELMKILVSSPMNFSALLTAATLLAQENLLNNDTAHLLTDVNNPKDVAYAIRGMKLRKLDIDGVYPYQLLKEFCRTNKTAEQLGNFNSNLSVLKEFGLYSANIFKLLDPIYHLESIVDAFGHIKAAGLEPKNYETFFINQIAPKDTAKVIIILEQAGLMAENFEELRIRHNIYELYNPLTQLMEKKILNKETFDFVKNYPESVKVQIVIWLNEASLCTGSNLDRLSKLGEQRIHAIYSKIESVLSSKLKLSAELLEDAINNVDVALHKWSYFGVMSGNVKQQQEDSQKDVYQNGLGLLC